MVVYNLMKIYGHNKIWLYMQYTLVSETTEGTKDHYIPNNQLFVVKLSEYIRNPENKRITISINNFRKFLKGVYKYAK